MRMMSGQQAVANVLGLEVNVKNGDHGIFVFQLLQAAEEEAFRVYNRATPNSNQSGSRQKQDWRWRNCLSMGSPCCLGSSGLGDDRRAFWGKAVSPAQRGREPFNFTLKETPQEGLEEPEPANPRALRF